MFVVANTFLTHTNDMSTQCNCQRQCETGINVIGGRSPVYANLRKHTDFVADEDEHKQGNIYSFSALHL